MNHLQEKDHGMDATPNTRQVPESITIPAQWVPIILLEENRQERLPGVFKTARVAVAAALQFSCLRPDAIGFSAVMERGHGV